MNKEENPKIFMFPDENGKDVEWIEVLRGKPDRRKPEWMFRTDDEYKEYLKNYKEDENE